MLKLLVKMVLCSNLSNFPDFAEGCYIKPKWRWFVVRCYILIFKLGRIKINFIFKTLPCPLKSLLNTKICYHLSSPYLPLNWLPGNKILFPGWSIYNTRVLKGGPQGHPGHLLLLLKRTGKSENLLKVTQPVNGGARVSAYVFSLQAYNFRLNHMKPLRAIHCFSCEIFEQYLICFVWSCKLAQSLL